MCPGLGIASWVVFFLCYGRILLPAVVVHWMLLRKVLGVGHMLMGYVLDIVRGLPHSYE